MATWHTYTRRGGGHPHDFEFPWYYLIAYPTIKGRNPTTWAVILKLLEDNRLADFSCKFSHILLSIWVLLGMLVLSFFLPPPIIEDTAHHLFRRFNSLTFLKFIAYILIVIDYDWKQKKIEIVGCFRLVCNHCHCRSFYLFHGVFWFNNLHAIQFSPKFMLLEKAGKSGPNAHMILGSTPQCIGVA